MTDLDKNKIGWVGFLYFDEDTLLGIKDILDTVPDRTDVFLSLALPRLQRSQPGTPLGPCGHILVQSLNVVGNHADAVVLKRGKPWECLTCGQDHAEPIWQRLSAHALIERQDHLQTAIAKYLRPSP